MAIFKLLVLSYMHTTLYISFFYSNNITQFYVVRKFKKTFEGGHPLNQQIWVWHMIFSRLFKNGGRVGKGIVKFCHPLQVANYSMLLVQNSLRNVNTMTFVSIQGVFCSRQVCFRELKIKLILLNLKHCA